MTRLSLTALAHEAVAGVLQKGQCAVDATVGNGYGTLFLVSKRPG